ncbi:hypothetical protein [Lacticaseibacillus sp. GG6-2]
MITRKVGLALVTTFGAVLIGGIAASQQTTQATCINGYYYEDDDTQVAGISSWWGTDAHIGQTTYVDNASTDKAARNTVSDLTSGVTHYQEAAYSGIFTAGKVYSGFKWDSTKDDIPATTTPTKTAQSSVNVQYVDGDHNNAVLYTQPWTGTPGTALAASDYNSYETTMQVFAAQGKTITANDVPANASSIIFPAADQTTTYTVVVSTEKWTTYPPATHHVTDMSRTLNRIFEKTFVVNGDFRPGKPDVQTQTFTRDYYESTIAAHSKYGDWAPTTATIPTYTVPAEAGYTAYVRNDDGTYRPAPTSYPALTLTADSAQPATTQIYYFQAGINPNE